MSNLRMQDYFPFLLKGERPGSVTNKVALCCNCTFLLKGGRPGWGWKFEYAQSWFLLPLLGRGWNHVAGFQFCFNTYRNS